LAILDFYAPEYGVGIEADGGQHYDAQGMGRDEIRKRELYKIGVDLLRFGDHEILTNINGVWEVIQETLKKKADTPSPQSSPPWVEDIRGKK
jgi:very-short-patch-repair endonuclease